MNGANIKKILLPAVLLLSLLFPLVIQNEYYLHIMTLAFIWIIAVYGLNLIAGYTGYLSLAHAGFFAIGAYAISVLTVKAEMNYWLAFLLSVLITSIIGFFIGLIALRTKEHYFAIYTLCVGYIIYLVIYKWEELTGGVRGFIGIPAPPPMGSISFDETVPMYYLVLFFLIIGMVAMYRIVHSLSGRTYKAIRNSEDLAASIGISTMRNKLAAFVLSTAYAGVAGALYASLIRFIGPDIGYTNIIFDMLIYLLVGGIGTLSGPVIGTILVVWVSQNLQFLQDYRMLIFGPLLTFLIIFYPKGIAGSFIQWRQKQKEKAIQKESAQIQGREAETKI